MEPIMILPIIVGSIALIVFIAIIPACIKMVKLNLGFQEKLNKFMDKMNKDEK